MRGIVIIGIVFLILEIAKEKASSLIKYLDNYQNNHEEIMIYFIDSLTWIVDIIKIEEFSTDVCMVLLTVYFIYGAYSKYKYLVRKIIAFNQEIKILLKENKNKNKSKESWMKLYKKALELKSEMKKNSIYKVLFSIIILCTLFITGMINDNWFAIVLIISIVIGIYLSFYVYNFSINCLKEINDLMMGKYDKVKKENNEN